jgi:hypothetical protein
MTTPKTAETARQLRLLAILLGIILLVWVSIEDQSVTWAILFAAAICVLAAAELITSSPLPQRARGWLVYPLAGVLGGAATAPIALLLMAIKTGIHGYAAPDYTPAQMSAVLAGFPIWVAAGAIIGLGAGIWSKNR